MQITSGIRAALSSPFVYNMFQNLIGSARGRKKFVEGYLNIEQGESLLDIGCGTAELVEYLPDLANYVGFDTSAQYIDTAKKRFDHRNAHFISGLATEEALKGFSPFDYVIATGLLHHLEDFEVLDLFKLVKKILRGNGKLITIDPSFVTGQSLISRALVKWDRGQNVRSLTDYRLLAESIFENVSAYHRNDLLRIPYDHTILVCS